MSTSQVAKSILLVSMILMSRGLSAQTVAEDVDTKVYVAWDDNRILNAPTQAERDRLSLSLARATSQLVDVAKWPEVKIDKATDARTLVDRYFDYYPSSFPRTTEFLARQIEELNGAKLSTSGTIKIPPVPVKPYEIWEAAPTALRSFSPEGTQYQMASSLSAIEIPETFQPPVPAQNLERVRARGATVVSFDSVADFRRAFTPDIRKQLGRALYVWVGDPDISIFPWLPVDFYEVPAPCTPMPAASTSAYLTEWNARRSTIGDAVLATRAKESPLVLIDWDFEKGHGRKVFEVVQLALRHFGVWDALSPYVEQFELNPKINSEGLKTVLAAYRLTTPPAIREQLIKSEDWIRDYVPKPGNTQDFDQGILQAVVWEHFSRRQTWVNLSFSVRNRNVDYDSSLINSTTFSFVAAGNKSEELPPYYFPQNISGSYHGRSINVTYGDRDGKVKGTYAANNPVFKTSVALLAQGANFTGCTITATDAGSSFASPWVAAAAWLKHLVDEVPNTEMRRTLISASEPLPQLSASIDSGGYFDPELLLGFAGKAPVGHAVRRDGTIERLQEVSLGYEVIDGNGDTTSRTLKLHAEPLYALALAKCPSSFPDGSTCLWSRRLDEPAQWPFRVRTFVLKIKPVGQPESGLNEEQFRNLYASIHF